MFNKKTFLGRAVLLSALVLFLSTGFISCQRDFQDPGYVVVGDVKAYKLTESDPICGAYESWGSLALYCSSDFVWATAASGTEIENSEEGCLTLSLLNWSTYENEDHFYKKDSAPVYVVYNTKDGEIDNKSGVLLFTAKTSPYGTPTIGCWYGVKFQIIDEKTILYEGAAGDAYKNVSTLDDAVVKFAYTNDDAYDPKFWETSLATRVAE